MLKARFGTAGMEAGMATWRRRDLERRSGERGRRVAQVMRVELVLAMIALLVAAISLWQALAAQSRADLLAHDLSAANARLRSLEMLGLPSLPARSADGAAARLPPLSTAPLRSGASPSP